VIADIDNDMDIETEIFSASVMQLLIPMLIFSTQSN